MSWKCREPGGRKDRSSGNRCVTFQHDKTNLTEKWPAGKTGGTLNQKSGKMKDKAYIGLLAGVVSPFVVILLFYLFRFNYLSVEEFIHQSILLKVHFKIISIGVFFADLALFYLFLRLNKNNAAKGVILAVFLYFFFFLVF